jgi:hypothetical protein
MSNIFVEQQEDGTYEATQNHRIIAKGNTQRRTIDRARRVKPDDLFWQNACGTQKRVGEISGAEFIELRPTGAFNMVKLTLNKYRLLVVIRYLLLLLRLFRPHLVTTIISQT